MHIVDVIDWITDREDLNELQDLEIVVREQLNKLTENKIQLQPPPLKRYPPRDAIRSVWGSVTSERDCSVMELDNQVIISVDPREFYDDDKNGTL